MIHKCRNLSRCSITQSSESMQQSVYRFFSYTSLQKVFKLILPPNHGHFLSNHRIFRRSYDILSAKPRLYPEDLYGFMEWSGIVFPSCERCNLLFTLQCSFVLRKIILEWLWVGIRISHFAVKNFRVFGKWRGTGKLAPKTPCVTTRVVKERTWSQRTPSIEELTEHQDLCGKHHQVARALEAVTISNMTTTEEPQVEEKQPVEKKVVGKSRCAVKTYVACEIESDIANMCVVIAWIWIVNVYCHDRFSGHMACSYCPDFVSFYNCGGVLLTDLTCLPTDVALRFFQPVKWPVR